MREGGKGIRMVNSREKREGRRTNPAPLLLFLDKLQGDLTRGATRQMISLVMAEEAVLYLKNVYPPTPYFFFLYIFLAG